MTPIEQKLQSLEATIKSFHTMKNLRVWATEENQTLKRSALDLIQELQILTQNGGAK